MCPRRNLLESLFVRMCTAYDVLQLSVQAEGCISLLEQDYNNKKKRIEDLFDNC